MSDNTHSQPEDLNLDEELDIELEDEIEEEEKPKNDINRQLLARAKKAEAELKKYREAPKLKEKNDGVDDEIKSTVQSLKLAEDKRQFGYENGLSPEETDYLFKINSSPTKELLEDPFIKGGLEAIRAKRRVENNTPSTTSRSPVFSKPKKGELTKDDKQEQFESWKRERFGK